MSRFSIPFVVGLVVAVAAMAAIGFVQLFGGPGYESALAAGLLVPSLAAVVAALDVVRARPEPFEAFCRGAAVGAIYAGAAYAVTLVHGARLGFCDVLGGSAHFALGPGVGALLGGTWGALAGELASAGREDRGRPRRRAAFAVLLALAGPLTGIAVSLVRFYTSPMIFAYDPFVGYFSGSIYDTIVATTGLVTYRAGSAATIFAAFVLALHLEREPDGSLAFRSIGRPGLLLAGAGALVASVTMTLMGPRLGHWQTAESISAELGALVAGDRCDVVYPRAMRLIDAQRFTRECDAYVRSAEDWLGVAGPRRITAYLFADSDQKSALMGAADTQVAKPWRHEIYVQASGYPHPVLGHEIMHVVAGAAGRGPFKVAGAWAGLLPNPGLIEGVAVAGAPRDGDLTPREWAKAMKDLGLLPPIGHLFALGFLGENSSLAYAASGAFVEFVKDAFGADALRRWYSGTALPEVVGQSWAALETRWHMDLDGVALPEPARAQAKAKFDRPAVFARRCPHVVDACKERADRMAVGGDEEGAIAEYERILRLDPHDASVRVSIAKSLRRKGERERALQELARLEGDESIPRHVRDQAEEELADDALAAGDGPSAAARYADLMKRTVDEDRLRTFEVKIAAANDPVARPAIVALLVGTPTRPPDKLRAFELLATWATIAPGDGLPNYLLARHYVGTGEFEEAAERLDRAIAKHLAIARVQVEAERLRLIVACGLGDTATATKMLAAYVSRPSVTLARREAAGRLVGRCMVPTPQAAAPR